MAAFIHLNRVYIAFWLAAGTLHLYGSYWAQRLAIRHEEKR